MPRTTRSGRVKIHQPITADMIEAQRGKDWACFCDLDLPCHADVLLELANPNEPPPQKTGRSVLN